MRRAAEGCQCVLWLRRLPLHVRTMVLCLPPCCLLCSMGISADSNSTRPLQILKVRRQGIRGVAKRIAVLPLSACMHLGSSGDNGSNMCPHPTHAPFSIPSGGGFRRLECDWHPGNRRGGNVVLVSP